MAALADLAAFDLSPERGFLPERDPLCALPASSLLQKFLRHPFIQLPAQGAP